MGCGLPKMLRFEDHDDVREQIRKRCEWALMLSTYPAVIADRICQHRRDIICKNLVKQCRDYAITVTNRSFVRDPNTLSDYYPTDTNRITINNESSMKDIQAFYRRDVGGIQYEFEQILDIALCIYYDVQCKYDQQRNKNIIASRTKKALAREKCDKWTAKMEKLFANPEITRMHVYLFEERMNDDLAEFTREWNKHYGSRDTLMVQPVPVPRITDMSYLQKDR